MDESRSLGVSPLGLPSPVAPVALSAADRAPLVAVATPQVIALPEAHLVFELGRLAQGRRVGVYLFLFLQ